MKTEMPVWAKVLFWTVGVANAALAVRGIYLMLYSVPGALTRYRPESDIPHFWIALAVMTVINVTVLALFVVAAYCLFRLKSSGVMLHSITSVFVLIYGPLIGGLWLVGHGIGRSIAAATGVGNMGIASFELLFAVPFVYPAVSTIVLQFARMRTAATQLLQSHYKRAPLLE